jgi:rubrerythrin
MYLQEGAQQGWQCPVCNAVNSPWQAQCLCGGKARAETFSTHNDIDWNKDTVWWKCKMCGGFHKLGESCSNMQPDLRWVKTSGFCVAGAID